MLIEVSRGDGGSIESPERLARRVVPPGCTLYVIVTRCGCRIVSLIRDASKVLSIFAYVSSEFNAHDQNI